ncbi:hypothetical protein NQZ68_004857, partial [Dissostichus eleginoides]
MNPMAYGNWWRGVQLLCWGIVCRWKHLLSQHRSHGCCNLRCSISCSDRDATYTSLPGRG